MLFSLNKLQRDLVEYLEGTKPSSLRQSAGQVYAVYIFSVDECIAYVRLTATLSSCAGYRPQVDLDLLVFGEQERGAEFLAQVSIVKQHILRSLQRHGMTSEPVRTNPVSRALEAASRWMEFRISSVF